MKNKTINGITKGRAKRGESEKSSLPYYKPINFRIMEMTKLATEVVDVYVEEYENGVKIDSCIYPVEFPKGWGFSQRFFFVKNHFNKIPKEDGTTYKFEIL